MAFRARIHLQLERLRYVDKPRTLSFLPRLQLSYTFRFGHTMPTRQSAAAALSGAQRVSSRLVDKKADVREVESAKKVRAKGTRDPVKEPTAVKEKAAKKKAATGATAKTKGRPTVTRVKGKAQAAGEYLTR